METAGAVNAGRFHLALVEVWQLRLPAGRLE